MAVDPKVVGGGAVVVAIGGGTGYAVSNAVSGGKETSDSPKALTKRELFEKKITDAGFVLLTTKETDVSSKTGTHWTKWVKIVEKVDTTANDDEKKLTKIKNLQTQCAGYEEDSQLQTAIKNCTELVTLKERATSSKFGLTALKTDDSGKTTDQTKWTEKQTTYASTPYGNLSGWENVVSKCKELEAKTHLESGFDQTYWTNYLKVCMDDKEGNKAKHDEAIQKSYWTAEKEVTTTPAAAA